MKSKHNHECHCGTAKVTPHTIGKKGCVRRMSPVAPVNQDNGKWKIGDNEITEHTLFNQRGYYRHPCGCWSDINDSVNSIEMD